MRFAATSVAVLASTLISSASAIITGVQTSSPIYAYNPFSVNLTTANYIQTVYDVAVVFGIQPAPGHQGALGNVISSAFLGPSKSNILTPITFDGLKLPTGVSNGQYILTAEVFSLFGISGSGSLQTFNQTITVAGF